MEAFGYNVFVGYQTSFYYYLILKFGTEFYETAFYGRVAAHHEDVSSSFFYDNRFHGDYGRMFAYIEQQFYLSKLTWQQYSVRIWHLCTYRESTCAWVYLRFGKIYQSFMRIYGVIG